MSFLLEDMISIEISENETREQEENLKQIAKQLEEIFLTENSVIPIEVFRKDCSKIAAAIKKLEEAYTKKVNSKAKSRIYEGIYKNIKTIRIKYSDFFTNDLIDKFVEKELYFGWKKEIYKISSLAEAEDFQEKVIQFNHEDANKYFEKVYKIVATILQAVEKYSAGATKKELEKIQYFAEHLVEESKLLNKISIFRKITNTAKAILWEIDREKNQHKNTVESLLDFAKTSPGWAGDDFEECLEYVNEVRRE
ncbi:hypothetical protein NIES4074_11510 [Cylindrospermum sp. NIES-4074]|nr:hypothetical protein NIES4074_11510 [Cylindrospermum sp. NIES-4074]